MKLKAVATRTLPSSLLHALDDASVVDAFRDRVIVPHLHVDPQEFGPATHYVQETDLTLPTSDGRWGIEVTLSKVSVNDRRSPQDFRDALRATQGIYIRLIEEHLATNEEAQLFVCLALDQAVKFKGEEPTGLVELPALTVKGKKTPSS